MHRLRHRFAFWFTNRFVPAFYPLFNPFAIRILESRFHPLMSWYVAVVRFHGRRSGRTYDVPFTYHRIDARTFECSTNRRGVWWRNLIGGAPARFLYRGRWSDAWAEAVEDAAQIAQALRHRDRLRAFLVDVPVEESVAVRVTIR